MLCYTGQVDKLRMTLWVSKQGHKIGALLLIPIGFLLVEDEFAYSVLDVHSCPALVYLDILKQLVKVYVLRFSQLHN